MDLDKTIECKPLSSLALTFHRMMNSWSHTQLMGNEVPIEELSQVCRPDITNQDMNAYHAVNGKELVKNEIARPCGLLAKYFPQGKQNFVKTDSFEFFKQSGKEIKLSTTGIAWEGLKGTKFRSTDKSKEWADIEDERFINWMRPNTFPNVYKAWGRLEEEIEPGLYTAKIKNGKFLIIQKIWILIYLWARSISVLQL